MPYSQEEHFRPKQARRPAEDKVVAHQTPKSSPYFDYTIPWSMVVEVDVSHTDTMQQMGIAVTMVKDWAYLPLQTQESTSIYVMLLAESRLFIMA